MTIRAVVSVTPGGLYGTGLGYVGAQVRPPIPGVLSWGVTINMDGILVTADAMSPMEAIAAAYGSASALHERRLDACNALTALAVRGQQGVACG